MATSHAGISPALWKQWVVEKVATAHQKWSAFPRVILSLMATFLSAILKVHLQGQRVSFWQERSVSKECHFDTRAPAKNVWDWQVRVCTCVQFAGIHNMLDTRHYTTGLTRAITQNAWHASYTTCLTRAINQTTTQVRFLQLGINRVGLVRDGIWSGETFLVVTVRVEVLMSFWTFIFRGLISDQIFRCRLF